MLTLTRKIGESVCIGDDIKVVVKEIKGKQVRLGIIAPREVYVCREELYLKIHQANVGATSSDANILDSISGLFGGKKGGPAQKTGGGERGSGKEGGGSNAG